MRARLGTRLILAVPERRDDAVVFILAEVELPPRPARLPPPAGGELGGPELLPRRRGLPSAVVLTAALAARVVDWLAAVSRPGWQFNGKMKWLKS